MPAGFSPSLMVGRGMLNFWVPLEFRHKVGTDLLGPVKSEAHVGLLSNISHLDTDAKKLGSCRLRTSLGLCAGVLSR